MGIIRVKINNLIDTEKSELIPEVKKGEEAGEEQT